MKKEVKKKNPLVIVLIIVAVSFVCFFIILPLAFTFLSNIQLGNVALIPIEGIITGNGASYLGSSTVSSKTIVDYIEQADKNPQVKVILLEINSPGGSAVASDEISTAIKKANKPVVSVIREVGASGGYWIASATEHIVANRMSITGSIGVISSYLEFSGLMEDYGVGYERLVAGERKDIGTPLKKLSVEEKEILQKKLDKIHDFFIEEIALNRNLPESDVRKVATGEFFLGIEALNLGLVDELGDKSTAENYIKNTYNLDEVDYVVYQRQPGLLEAFSLVVSDFFFNIGEGIGSVFTKSSGSVMLV